jgi:hypothetical protein
MDFVLFSLFQTEITLKNNNFEKIVKIQVQIFTNLQIVTKFSKRALQID